MKGETSASAAQHAPGDPRLVDTISALRDEVAGLREASLLRAIIEQAKGVLMERERISADEAFARLRATSQEHNVRIVEVAATMVGVTAPPPALPLERLDAVIRSKLPPSVSASSAWREFQSKPEVSAGVVGALLDVVASGSNHGEDAVTLLAELLRPFDVHAVVLYRRMPDESLAMVGSVGIPRDLVSSWSRLPPAPEFPYVAAVVNRTPYFWGGREERVAQFPLMRGLSMQLGASAVIPILEADEPVGVAGIIWAGVRTFTPEQTAEITTVVQRVSRMLLRNAVTGEPELGWLGAVLRLHLDPWILLDVIPAADGGIRDFVVVDAAHGCVEGRAALGQRVLAAWPALTADGTFEALANLAAGGGFWTTEVTQASAAPWGGVGSRLRVTRLGRRLAIVWRPVDPIT